MWLKPFLNCCVIFNKHCFSGIWHHCRSTRGICHFGYVGAQLAGLVMEEHSPSACPALKLKFFRNFDRCWLLVPLIFPAWSALVKKLSPLYNSSMDVSMLRGRGTGLKPLPCHWFCSWFLQTESLGEAGVWSVRCGDLKIESVLFADDVVLWFHETMTSTAHWDSWVWSGGDKSQGLFRHRASWII